MNAAQNSVVREIWVNAWSAAMITISGFNENDGKNVLSRGRVSIQTSKDPVGAPIFYRDVPLMPSETEKGIIKPLIDSLAGVCSGAGGLATVWQTWGPAIVRFFE